LQALSLPSGPRRSTRRECQSRLRHRPHSTEGSLSARALSLVAALCGVSRSSRASMSLLLLEVSRATTPAAPATVRAQRAESFCRAATRDSPSASANRSVRTSVPDSSCSPRRLTGPIAGRRAIRAAEDLPPRELRVRPAPAVGFQEDRAPPTPSVVRGSATREFAHRSRGARI
jgi:hypothetical protein